MGTDIPTHESRVIPLDADHIGVRLLVPLATFFTCAGTYWLGLQLSSGSEAQTVGTLASLVVAVAVALGMAWALERLLKRYWPSGRALHLDGDHITLRERRAETVTLGWGQHINVLTWRFTIPPRRGRVPKGWLCMACQLLQDEQVMTLYTFLPPDEAEKLGAYDAFTPLTPRKKEKKGADNWQLSSEQLRLHAAEQERWAFGAELTRTDFVDFVNIMGVRIEGWPVGIRGALRMEDEVHETFERPPSKGDEKPIQLG